MDYNDYESKFFTLFKGLLKFSVFADDFCKYFSTEITLTYEVLQAGYFLMRRERKV